MDYRLQHDYNGVVASQEDGTVLWIPNEPASAAWQTYTDWLEDGNTPDPAPEVAVIVPLAVSRYQAEVYMRRIGIWEAADALFMAMPDDDERKIAWLRAPTVERYSPSTVYALEQLNIAPEAADAMFVQAKKVE